MKLIHYIKLEDSSLVGCDVSFFGSLVPVVSKEHFAITSRVCGPAVQCHIPEDQNF